MMGACSQEQYPFCCAGSYQFRVILFLEQNKLYEPGQHYGYA